MTTPTVRPEVDSLLLDVDFGAVLSKPSHWQRTNGDLLTGAECRLAQSATEAELLALSSLSKEG